MDIEWGYLRSGWTSCKKTQEFLEKKSVEIKEKVNGNKVKYEDKKTWDILKNYKKAVVAKGKKIVEFEITPENKNEILKVVSGRTGKMRAPAIGSGDVIFVGYNDTIYNNIF